MSNIISYREESDKEIFPSKRRPYTHRDSFIKKCDLVSKLADVTKKAQSLTLELTEAHKKANDLQITISTLQEELQSVKDLKEVANEKIILLNTQLSKASSLIEQQQVSITQKENVIEVLTKKLTSAAFEQKSKSEKVKTDNAKKRPQNYVVENDERTHKKIKSSSDLLEDNDESKEGMNSSDKASLAEEHNKDNDSLGKNDNNDDGEDKILLLEM